VCEHITDVEKYFEGHDNNEIEDKKQKESKDPFLAQKNGLESVSQGEDRPPPALALKKESPSDGGGGSGGSGGGSSATNVASIEREG